MYSDGADRIPNRQSFSRRGCFGATMAELDRNCESRQVQSRILGAAASDAQLPFAHGSNVSPSRCSDMLAKIAALGYGLRNGARGSDCHWRGGGSRLRMFTTTRAGWRLLSVATFSAPPPGCDTFHGSCPGLLPDLVPGPLHFYAYALHGEFYAWRRDGVGNRSHQDCNRRV
jgi:hypothetical protein